MLFLSICTEINDWKKKQLKFLTCSWVEMIDWAPVNSKDSIWTTFQLVKICYYSITFSMIWNEVPQRRKNTCGHYCCTVQNFRSCEHFFAWSWTRQSTDWTQRINHFQVLHSSIRKTADVGAVLQLLHQILGCKAVRRVTNGHRIAVSSSYRERTGSFYKSWKESGMVEVAIKSPCQ